MFINKNIHNRLIQEGWELTFDESGPAKVSEAFPDGICASSRYFKASINNNGCEHGYELWITYKSDSRHEVDILKDSHIIKTVKIRNIISVLKRMEIL